jgi:hypothetical protein
MPISCIRFRSWSEFKGEFASHLPGRLTGSSDHIFSKYIFRGQMEASWGLKSSFDRIVPAGLDRNGEYKKWQKFFIALHSQLGRQPLHSGDHEVEAFAQHYGVATRLLDFSLSPYLAAFFAFFDALRLHHSFNRDVSIYAIDIKAFTIASKGAFSIISVKGTGNARIRNQLGKFLRNDSVYRTLEEYIDQEAPLLEHAVVKMCLPGSEAETALNDLILMGISPIDIYPDDEGIAMYVRLRQLLEGYGGN